MVRRSDLGVVFVLMLCLAIAAFAAVASAAKAPLKPPKAGTWKLIAAENTPTGLKVLGGVVGSFQVVGGTTIKGFHLTFVEEGESAGCAGGEGFESKGEGKKATVKFAPGSSAPIVKTTSGYLVAVANSGGTVQPAEVPIKAAFGNSEEGSISITLVPRKKEPRAGAILWGEGTCSVAFVVKPG
ncbi:MAG TPA: hypothetical protein VIJ21_06760 [Solirubrobacterales bacterium]